MLRLVEPIITGRRVHQKDFNQSIEWWLLWSSRWSKSNISLRPNARQYSL